MNEAGQESSEIGNLINRTRFGLLGVCVSVGMSSIVLFLLIVPPLFGLGLGDAFSMLPVAVAISGLTGTILIFLHEHWMRRLVWLAHPEGVPLPAYESVVRLTIKILLVVSVFSLPMLVATIYSFNVTTRDLMMMGLEGFPDYMTGYLVAFATLGIGYFIFERLFRKHSEVTPAADDIAHLHELSDLAGTMPLRSAIASMVLWGGAGTLASWALAFILHFNKNFALWSLLALSVIGIVSFPFQYFLYKAMFGKLRRRLLAVAGEGYRVENAGVAALSIEDEQAVRERLITGIRVALAAPFWGAAALIYDQLAFFYIAILIAYTLISVTGYVATYGTNIRRAAEHMRWAADGVGLILFVQYSGSLTTLAIGLCWVLIYHITLNRGFDTGIAFTTFYSAMYGAVLTGEYLGWLPHAPATTKEGELLDLLIHRSPWQMFHPSVPFLASFALVAGGMVCCAFMARVYRRRSDTGIRGLLDLD